MRYEPRMRERYGLPWRRSSPSLKIVVLLILLPLLISPVALAIPKYIAVYDEATDTNYFQREGVYFYPLGVCIPHLTYTQACYPGEEFSAAGKAEIDARLEALYDAGINTVSIGLLKTYMFFGEYKEWYLGRLDYFLTEAEHWGIAVVPCIRLGDRFDIGTGPKAVIEQANLTEYRAILAYMLSEEIHMGPYKQYEAYPTPTPIPPVELLYYPHRQHLDPLFWSWLVKRYGSIEAAEDKLFVDPESDPLTERVYDASQQQLSFYDAVPVSHNIPAEMEPGQMYNVQFEMKNTGNRSWLRIDEIGSTGIRLWAFFARAIEDTDKFTELNMVYFTPTPAPSPTATPVPNTCGQAQQVSCGFHETGTMTGCTDNRDSSCTPGYEFIDRWYKITPCAGAHVKVWFNSTNAFPSVAVFKGSCSSLIEVGCGGPIEVGVPAVVEFDADGSNYYIMGETEPGSAGYANYEIHITPDPKTYFLRYGEPLPPGYPEVYPDSEEPPYQVTFDVSLTAPETEGVYAIGWAMQSHNQPVFGMPLRTIVKVRTGAYDEQVLKTIDTIGRVQLALRGPNDCEWSRHKYNGDLIQSLLCTNPENPYDPDPNPVLNIEHPFNLAFKRFIDEVWSAQWRYTVRKIREIDPVTPLLSEQGVGLTPLEKGTYYADKGFLDTFSGAKHLDFTGTEGHIVSDEFRDGRTFSDDEMTAYLALVEGFASLGGKGVFYQEYGYDILYDHPDFPAHTLAGQKPYYNQFLDALKAARTSAGSVCFWFAEEKPKEGEPELAGDRGIFEPIDSEKNPTDPDYITPRPVSMPGTGAFANFDPPPTLPFPAPTNPEEIIFDKETKSWMGDVLEDKFQDTLVAIQDPLKTPVFYSKWQRKNSNTATLRELDDTVLHDDGYSPIRGFNAEFNNLFVQDWKGDWIPVVDGSVVEVVQNTPILLRGSVGNTGEATWLHNAIYGEGTVKFGSDENKPNALGFRVGLSEDVEMFRDATFGEPGGVVVSAGISSEKVLYCRMVIEGNTTIWPQYYAWFGEEIAVTLHPLAPPIVHFPMDEGIGGIVHNYGTAGSDGFRWGPTWVAGASGYALRFDGLNDRVESVSTAGYDRNLGSVILWVKDVFDNNNNYPQSVAFAVAINWITELLRLRIEENVALVYCDIGARGSYIGGYADFDDGGWHQVVVTWNTADNYQRLYIDGQFKAEGTYNGNAYSPPSTYRIGDFHSWYYWKGIMDELKVYDRVLTDLEIAYMLPPPTPTPTPTPTPMPMDECSGAEPMPDPYVQMNLQPAMSNATFSGGFGGLPGCADPPANPVDIWYRIPENSEPMVIYMFSPNFNTGFVVYSECNSGSFIGCSEDDRPDHLFFFEDPPLGEVLIRVYGTNATEGTISWIEP